MRQFIIFFFFCLVATFCANAQIFVKALSYNANNGNVIGVEPLTFSNSLAFSTSGAASNTRASLGLSWRALTNSNTATSFLLGLSTNNEVVTGKTNRLLFTNAIEALIIGPTWFNDPDENGDLPAYYLGGSLDMSASVLGSGGSINTSANGGSISTKGFNYSGPGPDGGEFVSITGGSIITEAGTNGSGGTIDTSDNGGSIITKGGVSDDILLAGYGGKGGSIDLSGGPGYYLLPLSSEEPTVGRAGGSINTSRGGGSIDTRTNGKIEFGFAATRTTLVGTATSSRQISLPDASGTILLTNGSAAGLTNFPSNLLRTNGSAAGLTNFPSDLLRTNGSAAGLTNFPTLNQNTTGTASNVTGVVALSNGGTGATNADSARTNLSAAPFITRMVRIVVGEVPLMTNGVAVPDFVVATFPPNTRFFMDAAAFIAYNTITNDTPSTNSLPSFRPYFGDSTVAISTYSNTAYASISPSSTDTAKFEYRRAAGSTTASKLVASEIQTTQGNSVNLTIRTTQVGTPRANNVNAGFILQGFFLTSGSNTNVTVTTTNTNVVIMQ